MRTAALTGGELHQADNKSLFLTGLQTGGLYYSLLGKKNSKESGRRCIRTACCSMSLGAAFITFELQYTEVV